MNITLIAIGKRMPNWVETGYQEYAKRLTQDITLQLIEIPMEHRPKNADYQKLAHKEGEHMLAAIPPGDKIIALTERGQLHDTQAFTQKLQTYRDATENLSFLIGGPEGLSPTCLASAHQQWSLSKLTFPHPLVRVIMAEQLYRAFSILNHHPYHR